MKHNVSEISISLSSLNSSIHTYIYLLDLTELVFSFVNVSVWRNRVSFDELALSVSLNSLDLKQLDVSVVPNRRIHVTKTRKKSMF